MACPETEDRGDMLLLWKGETMSDNPGEPTLTDAEIRRVGDAPGT